MSLRLRKNFTSTKVFKEITKEYIFLLQSKQASQYTIKSYQDKIRLFLKFAGEEILCQDITERLIEKYKKELLKTNRETSVNSHLTHLNTIFKYGNEKGYMSKVTINKLYAQEKQKQVYSHEALCELLREEPKETFMRYQARVIISTFTSTGLRLSELTSLQVRDVDFNNLVIYSRHTKTYMSRLLPISTTLKVILTEWINYRKHQSEEDTLFCNSFGEPLKQSTLRTLMNRYFKHKGVECEGIHQFRRTFITHAVNQNVDIVSLSKITGHKNLRVLDKYYVNSVERVTSLADIVSPIENINVINKRNRINK